MGEQNLGTLKFRNDEITALLRQRPNALMGSEENEAVGVSGSCDVSYVLFLEPRAETDTRASALEWIVEAAINQFSPSPVIAHCELVAPPIPGSHGARTHFATYQGHKADWQTRHAKDVEDGIAFYLIENGSRWRALPVFGTNAADRIRCAADENVNAPYSLSMYPTSARGLRRLAWLWSDEPKHMGHCATITSRVLKAAGLGTSLVNSSAWYSPGTLYTALYESVGAPLEAAEREGLTSLTPQECECTIDALLLKPLSYESVRELGDARCIDAVRALTSRVCATAEEGSEEDSRQAQKRLAKALLRWVLLREDPDRTGSL